jgi:NlpE N-terminal domain
MRTIDLLKFVFLPLVVILPVSRPSETSSTTFGVFAGTSLCADVSKPLLNIPSTAECDRTKWNLTLYVDPVSQTPTTYKLSSEYGYHIDNRTLVMKGSNVREGEWSVVKGANSDPYANVYQLDPANQQMSISFQEIDPNIIHLLDRERRLVIGSAAQSFTLSRIDKHVGLSRSTTKVAMKSNARSPGPSGSGQVAVFGGRSPCREVAQQLRHPVGADCFKLKWEITLHQDPNTLSPTTFKLKGTLFRDFDRKGTWTVLQGRPDHPKATVYKLDFDKNEGSLLFLKADDNILFFLHNDGSLMVGNSDFSYTLNCDK